MDVSQFNYRSQRAHRARFGRALGPWVMVLQVLSISLLVLGISFLFLPSALAWVLIGLSAIPAMVAQWYQMELKDVPVITDGLRVDDLLESDLLGRLHAQPTPQAIAQMVSKTNGGLFFAVRFGISGGFLDQLV